MLGHPLARSEALELGTPHPPVGSQTFMDRAARIGCEIATGVLGGFVLRELPRPLEGEGSAAQAHTRGTIGGQGEGYRECAHQCSVSVSRPSGMTPPSWADGTASRSSPATGTVVASVAYACLTILAPSQ